METTRIEEFCDTGTGGTPSRDRAERYFNGGHIPWVKSGELREDAINETEEHVTNAALAETNIKIVPAGALLVAMYGATVGRLGMLGIPATTNQAVCHIIPDPRRADTRYLFHALRSRVPTLLARRVGGAQPNISQGIVRGLEILLPSLNQQRRIAEVLDRADSLRAKRRAALAHLDTLTQAILVDMFGDPATNPKGWAFNSIGSVAEVQGGLQVTSARKMCPREVPYLRVANVYRGLLDLREIKTIRATDAEIARTTLAKDDFLVVEGHGNPSEVGRGALWDGTIPDCVHQNHLIRVRFNRTRVVPLFASEYLNSFGGRRHLLKAGNTTSGLNTISVSDVRATPLGVPPMSLQREFACRVRVVQKAKVTQRASYAQFDALFASLQHRAFRGEL